MLSDSRWLGPEAPDWRHFHQRRDADARHGLVQRSSEICQLSDAGLTFLLTPSLCPTTLVVSLFVLPLQPVCVCCPRVASLEEGLSEQSGGPHTLAPPSLPSAALNEHARVPVDLCVGARPPPLALGAPRRSSVSPGLAQAQAFHTNHIYYHN
jgi:hypothetical protein